MLFLLLLLLSFHAAQSIGIRRITNASYLFSVTYPAWSQTTCNLCPCRALSINAVAWNCHKTSGVCLLIMRYSSNDTGLRFGPDHNFYFLRAPWELSASDVVGTITSTPARSTVSSYAHPSWYRNVTFTTTTSTTTVVATANSFNKPSKVAVDPLSYSVFVADTNNDLVQRWTPGQTFGIPVAGGNTINSALFKPRDVAWHSATGTLYIADTDNHRVVSIQPSTGSMNITVVAGTGARGASLAELDSPAGIAVDASGTYLYVADTNNDRVLRWNLINTTAGGTVVAGKTGLASANAQYLDKPRGLALNQQNTELYIADTNNDRVQRWTLGWNFGVTVAGSPDASYGNPLLLLNKPSGIALDSLERLYVADTENSRVLLYSNNYTDVRTLVDDTTLNKPQGVAVDAGFNLYVADTRNDQVLYFSSVV